MNLGLNVEVVRDHHVIDDGLQDFVDLTFRGEQADLLKAINHVDLGLPFPGALGFNGARVLRLLTLILYRLRRVHSDICELRTTPKILQVITPQTSLRLVVNILSNAILEV